ncbi:MAG: hypothetical protein RJA19_1810 [Bacteroidota bacterium]|jgi:putative Holliday junction resolvase
MARWIGIDWGGRRTGLAVSDVTGCIATPLETVDTQLLLGRLEQLIREAPCAGLVVGIPSEGSDSSEGVRALRLTLKAQFAPLRIEGVDEGDTSWEARQALVQGGMPKKKREEKGATDRVAAAIILQRFLDGAAPGGLPPLRFRR